MSITLKPCIRGSTFGTSFRLSCHPGHFDFGDSWWSLVPKREEEEEEEEHHPFKAVHVTAPLGAVKARIRLEIEIEIGLDFDQSKQSSLNLKLVFFLLIG